jgi:hypothetical protein
MDRVRGTIRRRILVNFRVDPGIARRQLPPGFEPKLVGGYALAGVCLIRLEQERPLCVPLPIGASSENAAHRFAVYRYDGSGVREESVYIARRHSGSVLNVALGGRIFPGEHHRARFDVRDDDRSIELTMSAPDGFGVRLRGRRTACLPSTSVFRSVDEASRFFRGGSLGYSETAAGEHLDAIYLDASQWQVAPLDVEVIRSTYFTDPSLFPPGSTEFDCALLMTNIRHEWHRAASVRVDHSAQPD